MDPTTEQQVQLFASMSGTDSAFARSFLQGFGFDLEAATNAYFGGASNAAAPVSQPSQPPPSSSTAAGSSKISQLASEHGVDEATAAAIAAAQGEQSDVRAPIPAMRSRLFDADPPSHGVGRGPNFTGIAGMGAAQQEVFRDFEHEHQAMIQEALRQSRFAGVRAGGGPSRRSTDHMASNPLFQGATGMSEMFSPPKFLFHGTFDQAKKDGKANKKWLLVNIQETSEFLSHVLNRDLWKDPVVTSIVQNNFVFFQHDAASAEGQRYRKFYKPAEPFPHVAILDPRTGEMLVVIKVAGTMDGEVLRSRFIEQVTSFLDTSSMEPGAPPPVPRVDQAGASSNIADQSEDDQMAAAIAASLKETSVKAQHVVVDSEDEYEFSEDDSDVEFVPSPSKLPRASEIPDEEDEPKVGPMETEEAVVEESPVVVDPEPEAGDPAATSITMRLSNGKRVKRRFLKSSAVAQVFAFVCQEDADVEKDGFDLVMYPNVSLKSFPQDQSLEEAKILNTSLNMKKLS